ncbi:hypothetical protein PENCOP_c002G00654 [Penicillium coprophilum]|uniref:Uncharacterized protein n=1 Tax=Penicillium coprophilum TaxID=36646 RepID=A0A1V6V1W4_9EURO|nr:hypothetical protein PENCOP_c002G00654 [Penicillium coprophilum]
MSLRRLFKKARNRTSFQDESQPQETATVTTEGPGGSSIPVLSSPAEIDTSVPVPRSPRHIRYLNVIQRYFRRGHELAGHHAGLDEVRPQMHKFASHQVDVDAFMPHFEPAGCHGGLGFRLQMREFMSRLVGGNPQHQGTRQLDNDIANHQDINNQAHVEDHDYQNAHGFAIRQDFPSSNNEIEGYSLLRLTARMRITIRTASPVPSLSSNIPYYNTTDDENNELRGTDNSDDDPSSDQDSQVRRGRSLRRYGSPASDAFPAPQGSNHPSRNHSQVNRGRTLLRASSFVIDPWVVLWGPIGQPNESISRRPCGSTTPRQTSSVVSESASDPDSQEPRGRALRRASSTINDPVDDPVAQEPASRALRRAPSAVNDPVRGPQFQESYGRTPARGSSLVSEPCTELWDSLHRMGDPNAHLPRGASPVSNVARLGTRPRALADMLRRSNNEANQRPRRPALRPRIWASTRISSSTSAVQEPSSGSSLSEIFASSEEVEQADTRVERWIEEVQQASRPRGECPRGDTARPVDRRTGHHAGLDGANDEPDARTGVTLEEEEEEEE